MGVYDGMMYPPGYNPGADHSESRITDKRIELENLRDEVVKARELVKSDQWKELCSGWTDRIASIVSQYNPVSPTALSDAVFGMGMLRQIYHTMNRPQELINSYEKKKANYDKLVRAKGK